MDARRSLRTRLLYVWKRLPARWQAWLIWLGSPRVSYGAGAIALDAQGHVLLVHHRYRRGSGWGLPGGVSARGEQPDQTIVRELREELGVTATVERLVNAGVEPAERHLSLTYLVRLAEEPRPDGIEIDGYRFVAHAELPGLLGPRAARRLGIVLERCTTPDTPYTALDRGEEAISAPALTRRQTDTRHDSSDNTHTA